MSAFNAQGAGAAPSADYTAAFERFVPLPGFVRLDLEVTGGDAYLQITETIDRIWEQPAGNETLLRAGTHSIPLARPAYGYRIRAASASTPITIGYVRTIG